MYEAQLLDNTSSSPATFNQHAPSQGSLLQGRPHLMADSTPAATPLAHNPHTHYPTVLTHHSYGDSNQCFEHAVAVGQGTPMSYIPPTSQMLPRRRYHSPESNLVIAAPVPMHATTVNATPFPPPVNPAQQQVLCNCYISKPCVICAPMVATNSEPFVPSSENAPQPNSRLTLAESSPSFFDAQSQQAQSDLIYKQMIERLPVLPLSQHGRVYTDHIHHTAHMQTTPTQTSPHVVTPSPVHSSVTHPFPDNKIVVCHEPIQTPTNLSSSNIVIEDSWREYIPQMTHPALIRERTPPPGFFHSVPSISQPTTPLHPSCPTSPVTEIMNTVMPKRTAQLRLEERDLPMRSRERTAGYPFYNLMKLVPTKERRLACNFCRVRKIKCERAGATDGAQGLTDDCCKPCARRSIPCIYPSPMRRVVSRKLSQPPLNDSVTVSNTTTTSN